MNFGADFPNLDFGDLSLSDVVVPDIAEDIGQLDIRVGKVTDCVSLKANPKLLIETVDIGEWEKRQACSELANRYTPDQLVGRKVIVLCNANPVEKRGVDRKALLLCAENNSKIELLNPPPDSQVGDFVAVDGFYRRPEPTPPSAEIMALYEKSPFAKVSADLKVNHSGQAVYKGKPLKVDKRQGFVTADSFKDCNIIFE